MENSEVMIGAVYAVKIGDRIKPVRIVSKHPNRGWAAVSVETNRSIHIKSAQRLRKRLGDLPADTAEPKPAPKQTQPDPTRVDGEALAEAARANRRSENKTPGERKRIIIFRTQKGGMFYWRLGDHVSAKGYMATEQARRAAIKAHPDAEFEVASQPMEISNREKTIAKSVREHRQVRPGAWADPKPEEKAPTPQRTSAVDESDRAARRSPSKSSAAKNASKKKTASKRNPEQAKATKPARQKRERVPDSAGGRAMRIHRNLTDKPKRPSGLDLAAKVLAEANEPLSAKAIAERAIEAGWKTNGRTPWATLYAAMTREIADKGEQARFRKVDRGRFAAA